MNALSNISFTALPTELKSYILSFVETTNLELEEIKPLAQGLLSLRDKEIKPIIERKVQELFTTYQQRLSQLCRKYSKYNGDYESACSQWNKLMDPSFSSEGLDEEEIDDNRRFLERFKPDRSQKLLDALSTGCQLPDAIHSVNVYTPDVEKDIKNIVLLMPASINYHLGHLRLRDGISPLGMACMNPNIPIHMIEWLFQHGANANDTWCPINNPRGEVRIINSLESCQLGNRGEVLISLFRKYGAQPKNPVRYA